MHDKRQRPHIVTTGVCIERDDRYYVVYRGTREALIAAGLAKPEHFPGEKKHLSWHYPAAGENWSIRRREGKLYCLTKLKDKRGIVDQELAAFKLAAAARARGDSAFQGFLQRVRDGISRRESARVARSGKVRATPCGEARIAAPYARSPQPAGRHADALGRLALGTLLAGITLYLWLRKS